MLLCVLTDLHLPEEKNAPQYRALRFACDSIRRNRPDAVAVLGDMTADGAPTAVEAFRAQLDSLGIPVVALAGNSDLRRCGRSEAVKKLFTAPVLRVGGYVITALDDADGKISAETLGLLGPDGGRTIVLKHHPSSDGGFAAWKTAHPDAYVLAGHLHLDLCSGGDFVIQALDPDKAIGEPPCVTYLDFSGEAVKKRLEYFPCEPPRDLLGYIGLSCSKLPGDICFASEHKIQNIELHNAVAERSALRAAVDGWRSGGGRYLSLHMPECTFSGDSAGNKEAWDNAVGLASELRADGVTVHVPKHPVSGMEPGGEAWNGMLDFLERQLSRLPEKCVVGIENMHMTGGETSGDGRRFGYLPQECVDWKRAVSERLGGRTCGLLLDIGHARNNPPFSQRYTLGSWYALVGRQTVAYHIHQVVQLPDGRLENHMPFTGMWGPLISLASFFSEWENGGLNKKPVFLELRRPEYYEPSLRTLGLI